MQIEIRRANREDIPQISDIWRECFAPSEEYIKGVFSTLFFMSDVFILSLDKKIVSSLFLIPIEYVMSRAKSDITFNIDNEIRVNGKYLYGVSTLSNYRGKGYSRILFSEAISKDKLDFIITRPASPTLFDFYRNQGFDISVPRGTIAVSDILNKGVNMEDNREFLAEKIGKRVRSLYQKRYEWSNEMLRYIVEAEDIDEYSCGEDECFCLAMNLSSEVSNSELSEGRFLFAME